jgi:LmbE family N-acetylglucosaminyl deacetylase
VVTTEIAGDGTTEATWSPWLAAQHWPGLDLAAIAGRRVVTLAAHPDDEVLGVGGLLASLAARHHKIVMVWATDGEASHPDSAAISPPALGRLRRAESRRALAQLGVQPVATHHLGMPDGGLASRLEGLHRELGAIICPGDVVIAPWEGDGHPDHEAVGRAGVFPGTTRWSYPVWMWHWAQPDDPRVPWPSLRAVSTHDVTAKAAAIAQFVSQTEAIGPAPEDAAILPPHVVSRFQRSNEWILV